MAGLGDLLGTLMQGGLSSSAGRRLDHAVGEQGLGQPGGGGLLGGLMNAAKGMTGGKGLSSLASNPVATGGLGALAGALFGGGSDSVKGAVGGGAMALLAGLAFQALKNMNQGGGAPMGSSGDQLPLGLRAPENPQEERELEATAELILKGMINAAKADGQIDNEEMQRILGRLKEAGADDEAQRFVLEQMGRPLALDGLVAEIPNQAVAAEVYAASLFAIEVDTDAERDYLSQLAGRTGLDQGVVQQLHRAVGVG
jgi:uncharacterized membrane protein YebE (DUF533 family)